MLYSGAGVVFCSLVDGEEAASRKRLNIPAIGTRPEETQCRVMQ